MGTERCLRLPFQILEALGARPISIKNSTATYLYVMVSISDSAGFMVRQVTRDLPPSPSGNRNRRGAGARFWCRRGRRVQVTVVSQPDSAGRYRAYFADKELVPGEALHISASATYTTHVLGHESESDCPSHG